MPRIARNCTDFIHVVLRGVGKQILFESDGDRRHYLRKLAFFAEEEKVTVVAYCLMENHVHLLLHDPMHHVSTFMHRFNTSYARFFNVKYDRCGHLFQNRYLHEDIYDTRGLLSVYRYILRNPEKAGICKAAKYAWSSYREYGRADGITDTSLIFELLGGQDGFETFLGAADENEDEEDHIEGYRVKHDDEWARRKLKKLLNVSSGMDLQKMKKEARDEALRILRKARLTLRQIERLTGISQRIVCQVARRFNAQFSV